MKKIEEEGQVSVPRHLADGNRDAAATGQGKDYVYPHEMEGHFTPQQYLPKRLLGTYFYAPSQEGYESQVTARLEMWREAQRKALGIERREDVPAMSEEQIKEMKRKIKATVQLELPSQLNLQRYAYPSRRKRICQNRQDGGKTARGTSK